jgi:hypothetical protein
MKQIRKVQTNLAELNKLEEIKDSGSTGETGN